MAIFKPHDVLIVKHFIIFDILSLQSSRHCRDEIMDDIYTVVDYFDAGHKSTVDSVTYMCM